MRNEDVAKVVTTGEKVWDSLTTLNHLRLEVEDVTKLRTKDYIQGTKRNGNGTGW